MARSARPPLTAAAVIDGAVALADAEGLGAVTMRRLAAGLGVEAMSLYHHLPGKEQVLDGLAERLLEEIRLEVPEPGGAWRQDLRDRCLGARRVMLRHPWGPALIGSRASIPPAAFAHFEGVLATLVGGGFDYALAHRALHALGSMPLGFVQELFTAPGSDDPDGDDAAYAEQMATALPHLAAMVAAELHAVEDPTLGWCDSQTEFEFTLDLLLDGLDRLAHGR